MNLITTTDTSSRRVAAVGMYDGVHEGHRYLIDFLCLEGRHRGLRPAVVTFSRHPLSVLRPDEAPRLLTTLRDRVEQLSAAGAEDVILLSFSDALRRMSAEEFIKTLRREFAIDALVVGFNNNLGHDRVSSAEKFREIGERTGVEVIMAPEFAPKEIEGGISSSAIRRALLEGRPEVAARLLGHPFAVEGKVVRGNHLGASLGFPTANVSLVDPALILPATGAYAAYVTTPDGIRRPAMVNIGFRPTVAQTMPEAEKAPGVLSVEAHIIDYAGYLYDDNVKIEFVGRLRGERKFKSTSELASQLASDREAARKLLS